MTLAPFIEAFDALPVVFKEAKPLCGLILGSGWREALDPDRELAALPYSQIPNLGASTVVGHSGELLLLDYEGAQVICFSGRRHYYEGQGWVPVVMPIELMRRMGVKQLLLTNAAGGISRHFQPGDLMVIRDHVNVTGFNPLQGINIPEWGPRFPDMSAVYSPSLSEKLHQAAPGKLKEGTYIYSTGPAYETPAEIRFYQQLGVDAVGMSTVPEALLAHACGMQVAALSCITNMAAGITGPLNHAEVLEQSKLTQPLMAKVVQTFIRELAREAQPCKSV